MILTEKDKERFEGNILKTDTCWIWRGKPTTEGYGRIRIKGKQIKAHRLSYLIFKGSISENLLVCHSCDNRLCVNPNHLWLGTDKDNNNDKISKGRAFIPEGFNTESSKFLGELNGKSKLTESKILEIRNKYNSGAFSMQEIANLYEVTRECIREIIHRRTWSHI